MDMTLPIPAGNAHLQRQLTAVLLWFLLFTSGRGYPGGAPDMACESMVPSGHGVGPQTSPSPYSIMVSKKSYKPGETLQIIVSSEGEDYFKGMFLQARMIGCGVNETKTVGVFTAPDMELETKHCFGEVHSAVTHNSAHTKRLKTFYWTAPVLPAGHVVMRATLVREIDEYWINVESDLVADLTSNMLPRCPPSTSKAPPTTTTTATTTTTTMKPSTTSRSPSSSRGPSFTTLAPQDHQHRTSQQTTKLQETHTTNLFVASQDQDFTLVTRIMTTIEEAERKVIDKQPKGTERMEKEGEAKDSETITDDLGPFPAWLGPTFNRDGGHIHTTQADDDEEVSNSDGKVSKSEEIKKVPSWLIPAYQRSVASSADSLCSSVTQFRLVVLTVLSLVVSLLIVSCTDCDVIVTSTL